MNGGEYINNIVHFDAELATSEPPPTSLDLPHDLL